MPGWSSRAMTAACSTPSSAGQCGLDFAEFDAVPADLDLLIGAPEILQLPVSTPAHQIPGAIHPRPGRPERAGARSVTRSTRPCAEYPTPTPRPATYNSPITPAGTGRNHSSSTNNAAVDTGAPIGAAPDPGVKGALIDAYTVISVGP